MKPNIVRLNTPLEVADKISAEIFSISEDNNSEGKNIFIAVSGGNTPKILFSTLAESYGERIKWSKIHFFWVDERCVPPEDRDSNYGMTKKFFFDKIEIPEENIHRMRGENIPEKEAVRYTAEIDEFLKFKDGLPKFDLIILGIGADGHTASIFPDQLELLESENVCSTAVHPESGQKRITLTGKVINNADNVFFMITGADKAKIVSEIINKRENYKKYPSAHIDPGNGNYAWYLDAEAAKLI